MIKRKTQVESVIDIIFHFVDWNITVRKIIPSVSDILFEIRKTSNESPHLYSISKKTIETASYYDGARGTASSFLSDLRREQIKYDKLPSSVVDYAKELKMCVNQGNEYVYIGELGSIMHCKLGLSDVINGEVKKEKSEIHRNAQYMLSSIFTNINYGIYVPTQDKLAKKGNIYEHFDIDQSLGQDFDGKGKFIDFIAKGDITITAEIEESTEVLSGVSRMQIYSNACGDKNILPIVVSSKTNYRKKFDNIVGNNNTFKKMNIRFIDYTSLEKIYYKVLEMKSIGIENVEIKNYILNKLTNKK